MMIKFENEKIVGFEQAIISMRNSTNSLEKSDSFCIRDCTKCSDNVRCSRYFSDYPGSMNNGKRFRKMPYLGKNDLYLTKNLINTGEFCRKFLKMIVVYVDISAPLYFWDEIIHYVHINKTGINSINKDLTMRITKQKLFELKDFSFKNLDENTKCNYLFPIIKKLNANLADYIDTKNEKYLDEIRYLLPNCYNMCRTIMVDYEILFKVYQACKNHYLDEIKCHNFDGGLIDKEAYGFCDWIERFPYFLQFVDD